MYVVLTVHDNTIDIKIKSQMERSTRTFTLKVSVSSS